MSFPFLDRCGFGIGDAAYRDCKVVKRTLMTGAEGEGKKMMITPVFGKVGFTSLKGVMLTGTDLQNVQAYLKDFSPPD